MFAIVLNGGSNDYFFGRAKTMSFVAVSLPETLPALTAQLRKFDALVPHLPEPIVPVTILNFVFFKTPVALMVTGVAVSMSHCASPLAVARHSVM
jgi:hypothetical protein